VRLQLVAKVNDPELFKKSMHERGVTLYQEDPQGSIMRVVYFSTSRVVDFVGSLDEALANIIRADGFRVESINLDESHDSVQILQAKST
jgi:hypothetical protein